MLRARPFYAEVADVMLDVDELSPTVVVDRIMGAMDARTAQGTESATATETATATVPGEAR